MTTNIYEEWLERQLAENPEFRKNYEKNRKLLDDLKQDYLGHSEANPVWSEMKKYIAILVGLVLLSGCGLSDVQKLKHRKAAGVPTPIATTTVRSVCADKFAAAMTRPNQEVVGAYNCMSPAMASAYLAQTTTSAYPMGYPQTDAGLAHWAADPPQYNLVKSCRQAIVAPNKIYVGYIYLIHGSDDTNVAVIIIINRQNDKIIGVRSFKNQTACPKI